MRSLVVGYSTGDLRDGFTAAGAQFVTVSETGINLQDIKVVGYKGENADTVNIQILDRMGKTVTTYYWADLPEDDIYGWLDDLEEIPEDVVFQPGTGLWIFSSDDSLGVQTAGQVPTKDTTINLRNGFTMVANPTPVAINLQDIVVSGYEGENADTVNIQILDRMGKTITTYYWADLPDDDIYGWLDDMEEIPEDVTFDPGAALWIFSSDATLSVTIPGVIIK